MSARQPPVILLLALIGGCDPISTPEGRTALAACFDACKDRGLSETDQSTCRLNCAESAKVSPFPTKPPPLASAANCIGLCEPGNSPGAQACVAACRPEGVAPAVLDRITACVADCQSDVKTPVDDRATCRLLCAQDGTPAP